MEASVGYIAGVCLTILAASGSKTWEDINVGDGRSDVVFWKGLVVDGWITMGEMIMACGRRKL